MNKLPLRNWTQTACQAKAFGKMSVKSAKSSKIAAKKVYVASKTKIQTLKRKLPQKSIYKKYGYF
jgi:hypothetical protein